MTPPLLWRQRLFALLRRDSPLAYFAAYRLPEGTLEVATDIRSGIDGLSCSHVVPVGDADARLFTYWTSSTHFHAGGQLLARRLAVDGPDSQGPVTQVAPAAPPWWKDIRPHTLVLSAAAAFGAFEALTNHFDRAFAAPHLMVRPNPVWTPPIEGDAWGHVVTVESKLGGVAHQDLAFKVEAWDNRGHVATVQLVEETLPWLAASGTVALVSNSPTARAGTYLLRVSARGGAGFARFDETFKREFNVRVWPRVASAELSKKASHGGWARYAAHVAVGPESEKGLACELQLLGSPGLRFTGQIGGSDLASHDRALREAGSGSASVALLTWRTKPLKARTVSLTEIELNGPASTDWDALVSRAEVVCTHAERNHVPYPSN